MGFLLSLQIPQVDCLMDVTMILVHGTCSFYQNHWNVKSATYASTIHDFQFSKKLKVPDLSRLPTICLTFI
ncbi:hypothetical protein Hanom_Chr13g01242961 [Helianthus anomalus]